MSYYDTLQQRFDELLKRPISIQSLTIFVLGTGVRFAFDLLPPWSAKIIITDALKKILKTSSI